MISTASMVRLGKVYNNLMVDVKSTNLKLVNRAKGIIAKASNCSAEVAEEFYEKADRNVKLAIMMILSELDKITSEKLLVEFNGHLKNALSSIDK